MKKPILYGLTVMFLASVLPVQADHQALGDDPEAFYDYAKVTRVEPFFRQFDVSVPQQQCWNHEVPYTVHEHDAHPRAAAPMIVGGVIGGVIGHQFGKGRRRDLATLAGSVIGASLGHDHAYRSARTRTHHAVRYEQRCRTVMEHHTEERVEGYNVTYRYKGRIFQTRMPYDPGKRLRVRVRVAEAGDYAP